MRRNYPMHAWCNICGQYDPDARAMWACQQCCRDGHVVELLNYAGRLFGPNDQTWRQRDLKWRRNADDPIPDWIKEFSAVLSLRFAVDRLRAQHGDRAKS